MVIRKLHWVKSQLYDLNFQKTSNNRKYFPQYLAAFLANLTSFSIGLNFGWSSPTLPILQSPTSPLLLSVEEISWIVSIQPLGDFIGAPLSGILGDIIGRKRTLLLSTIPHLIGWLLIAFSTTGYHLIIARLLSGVASGMVNQSMPMYIGEISEPQIRGVLGSGITLILMIGITCINILGGIFDMRTTALICAIIPIVTLITFMWMPESPYYYLMKGNSAEAKKSLHFLRQNDDVDTELMVIRDNVELQMKNSTTFVTIFSSRINRKILSIVMIVRIIQQSCGLSAVTYYLLTIFNESGLSLPPLAATMIYLTGQMLATSFCTIYCDKFGRVPLLLFSLFGAALSLYVLGGYFFARDYLYLDVGSYSLVPLIGMLSYVVVLSCGYGTLPTLIAAELFPTNIKSKAMCLAHLNFAFCIFVSSKLFLYLQTNFGTFVPFWVYASGATLGIFYTWFCVPETKGKTLEEIQILLNK